MPQLRIFLRFIRQWKRRRKSHSKVSEKAEEEEEERKKGDLETPTFSVGDIRRRLTEVEIPHKVPVRDPDDPSGVYACLHV